jgi:hypothetical protein
MPVIGWFSFMLPVDPRNGFKGEWRRIPHRAFRRNEGWLRVGI